MCSCSLRLILLFFLIIAFLAASIASLLHKGGDVGPTPVRDQALPDHRHGQLHAPEGAPATDAIISSARTEQYVF